MLLQFFSEYNTGGISVIFCYPNSAIFLILFAILCYCAPDLAFRCKKRGWGGGGGRGSSVKHKGSEIEGLGSEMDDLHGA